MMAAQAINVSAITRRRSEPRWRIQLLHGRHDHWPIKCVGGDPARHIDRPVRRLDRCGSRSWMVPFVHFCSPERPSKGAIT